MESLHPLLGVVGAIVNHGLLTVISYRMARRGIWLATPWLVTLCVLALQAFGMTVAARDGGISLNWAELLPIMVPAAAASGALVMLIALAVAGPRLKRRPQVETV